MERSIILLIIVVVCLYLVLDSMMGQKKYIDRFVSQVVPNWDFSIKMPWQK